ncbi:major facilitator superfamily domain-containing protein [Gongronella butleri]|nr:major facilitator superfamily domain-containing protein [Gongronella butleri]
MAALDEKWLIDDTDTSIGNLSADNVAVEGYVHDLVYTPQEEITVRRKIDRHLMTFVLVCALILSLDNSNLPNAISDHMPEQLGFDNTWINAANTVSCIVVTLGALANNFIVPRVGAYRWIPILMSSWAIAIWAHCLLQDKVGYMVVRIFLALPLAGFIPTCLVYLTTFYKTKELPQRLAWFWAMSTFASVFSGLLAFAVLHLAGRAGLHGWQWLFLIDGVVCHFVAILALQVFLFLPSTPAHTGTLLRGRKPWLTEREAQIAVTRIIRDDTSKTEQKKSLTFADIHCIPRIPIDVYFPTMIREFGFEVAISTLLTVPAFLVCLTASVLVARHADKRGNYAYHAIFCCVWFLAGVLTLELLPDNANKWTLYGALLFTQSSPSYQGMLVGWSSANIAPVGKRAIFLGAVNSVGYLSGVSGSQIYQQSDYPRYHTGNWVCVGLAIVPILLLVFQHFRYLHLNRKREATWIAMTEKEQKQYLEITADKGNDRLDYKFII